MSTVSPKWKFARTPSAIALIVANTVPLLGAIFLDWSIFSLMFLFWLENVIVGLFNVVKMLTCRGGLKRGEGVPVIGNIGLLIASLFMAGFFTVHYGMFCTVHGVFVFALFGKEAGLSVPNGPRQILGAAKILLIDNKLIIAALTIFISHLFSLIYNYFLKGERWRADLGSLMARPYGRIVVLHITIIFGGFAAMALGSPVWALVLLVVLKTGVDLTAHIAERAKMSELDPGSEQQPYLRRHGLV